MNPQPTRTAQPSPSLWKRIGRVLWSMRFLYLQAAVLAAVAWVLWPLRDATALPNPPLPSYTPEPPDRQETLVLGSTVFAPGTQGAVRVIVYDPDDGQPIPAVQVRVSLAQHDLSTAGQLLFSGQTNAQGTAQVTFDVPDDIGGDPALVVHTEGQVGRQRVVYPITVRRRLWLYLATDKPLYSPGQSIHMRLLAFDDADALPAPERPVTFTVADARGNRIWSATTRTSQHGLAYADCPLADEVNTGNYRVSATVADAAMADNAAAAGHAIAERAVAVEPYTRPHFQVEISTTRPYYWPGQSLRGTVRAVYPGDRPVAGAQVAVQALTGPARREIQDVQSATQGLTDERGAFAFTIDPPASEQGPSVPLSLAAEVTDETGHVERVEIQLPAAEEPLLIAAAAESGVLKPGIENLIYLLTTYPDGHPAQCTLALDTPDKQAEIQTDRYGLAEFRYQPASGQPVTFTIAAQDANGQQGYARFNLAVEPGPSGSRSDSRSDSRHLLLRPERAIYRAGESIHLDLFASGSQAAADAVQGAVYLDVHREGQTVATYDAVLSDGQAAFDVDPGDLLGALTLHAFAFMEDGTAIADTRMVMVRPARDLDVSVHAERERYAPQDKARVSIHVTDEQGKGVPSVVAVTVTDASMSDPPGMGGSEAEIGVAPSEAPRLLWITIHSPGLDRAWAAPLYQAAPFVLPEDGTFSQGADRRRAQDMVAQVAWSAVPAVELLPRYAGAVSKPRPTPEHVQRQFDAVNAACAQRRHAFTALSAKMIWASVGLCGLLWAVTLAGTWRGGALTLRSLGGSLLMGAILLVPVAGGMALLAYLGQKLFGPGAILLLGMSWGAALLALLVYGWERRDGWAQLACSTLAGYLALGWGLRYAARQGGAPGLNPIAIVGWAALGMAWLALYTFGAGLMRRRERGGAAATFAAILLLLVTFVGGLAIGDAPIAGQGGLPEPSRQPAPAWTAATGTPPPTPLQPLPPPPPLPHTHPPSPTAPAIPLAADHNPQPLPGPRPWSVETLYWNAAALTDQQGNAILTIPMNDTSATWRLSVLASTQDGALGVAQARLTVFDPLPVTLALPHSLTVGDELDVPVTIDNLLSISQTARITVTQASWFRIRERGMEVQEIEIPAHDTGTLYVPLQVQEWGAHTFEIAVQADGAVLPNGAEKRLSHPLTVVPDGKPVVRRYSRQTAETDTYKIRVPWSAIQGTDRVVVKLYGGWSSILAEGLQSALLPLLAADHNPQPGLAEWHHPAVSRQVPALTMSPPAPAGRSHSQVVATTRLYPLLKAHLSQEGQLTSENQSQIERNAALDYQRLLRFETAENGFSAFGLVPADLIHTASGLMCLGDLARLYPIDPAVLDRTAEWLFHHQSENGAWRAHRVPPGWERLPRIDLPFTAYVTWALIEAGYADTPQVQLAVAHLERYLDQAQDPYTLALAIHALIAYGSPGSGAQNDVLRPAIARLAGMAKVADGLATWHGKLETFSGAIGATADVERTALAVDALLRSQAFPELAAQGLAMLANGRDVAGTWGSLQATLWALRALAAASEIELPPAADTMHRPVRVRVTVRPTGSSDENEAEPAILSADVADVAHVLTFDQPARGYNDVEITPSGGSIFYQLAGTYVLPWSQVPPPLPEEEEVSLTISYDRTSVTVGETITATVGVMLNRPGVSPLVALELGLPPGLDPVTRDWDALVANGVIARYERVGEQIVAYLADLSAERPVRFAYRLQARFPLRVKTQLTHAWDMADPQRPAIREPVEIEVLGEADF